MLRGLAPTVTMSLTAVAIVSCAMWSYQVRPGAFDTEAFEAFETPDLSENSCIMSDDAARVASEAPDASDTPVISRIASATRALVPRHSVMDARYASPMSTTYADSPRLAATSLAPAPTRLAPVDRAARWARTFRGSIRS